ncbi:hypothetical protein HPB52_014747 [Rhipicephalus sanguineus]|uniref:Nlr family card domain protein n=1 Tax=Rhipicephalus sanguineus TaxID=34632 RepID=A0A9D4SSX3_RHISA|nr:hypothetical protein HPB52_014747 [Rhipicephalus sanguineus]
MTSAKGFFSGHAPDYRRPCTSGEGRLCDIFRDLHLWNEFFWHVRLELRELSPGELSLVDTYGARLPWEMRHKKKEATTLLWHLLTLHRCVVSVKLNPDIIGQHDQVICDALRQSSSLIRLDMDGGCCIGKTASYRLIAVLPHLTQLRELELRSLDFGDASSERLAEYLASTRSLRTLIMNWQLFNWDHAIKVVRGLKRNVTITTLSLNTSTVDDCWLLDNAFPAYFLEVSTLRTLSVDSSYSGHLHQILEPLLQNNILSELNLSKFLLNFWHIQLITELISTSRTLKSLNLIGCGYKHVPQQDTDTYRHDTESFGNVSSRIYPWVVALTENQTLEELSLSLSWYDAGEWRSFFKALASNASLKKVNVNKFRREDVAEIFRAMRETGVQGRFFVGAVHTFEDTVVAMTECKEVSCIKIDSNIFPGFEPAVKAPCLMQSWSHVTSLCMVFDKEISSVTVSSMIALCITGAMALRALSLTFRIGWPIWKADHRIQRALVQAMVVNRTMRSLDISGLCFDETEAQMLANALQSSRTLCEFYFSPDDDESTFSFLRKLSPIVSSNYTVLGLHLHDFWDLGGDFFTVADVVRRNNSLVTRATHFVVERRHKYCAAALELVHSTPGLVARVQNSACVDENEAVQMIRRSLNCICELDDFMRLTGVVKDSVACHPRGDGKMQLVDLNRDSWLCIREYLKVSDILPVQ